MSNELKAILFDSGRVLNGPKTGNWFISPKFFDYVNEKAFYLISRDKREEAFEKANEYINSIKLINTMEEELKHFIKFYTIFSNELPELKLKYGDIKALANDLVYNSDKYQFFDDAINEIPKLSEKYKLAIVSDAWPSLKNVYEKAGLSNYFKVFTISSMVGVTKPNERMFLRALNDLNVLPKNAVFIDDNLSNCEGAMGLGIHSVLLCRNKVSYIYNKIKGIRKKYEVINTLDDLSKTKMFTVNNQIIK